MRRNAARGSTEQERNREYAGPRLSPAPGAGSRGTVTLPKWEAVHLSRPRAATGAGKRRERAIAGVHLRAGAEPEPATAAQHAQRGPHRSGKCGEHATVAAGL